MLLHENKDLFKYIIIATSEKFNLPISIVEKDYYVTMILKLLSEKCDCVFKGGTSLSKCYHIINRFSEDIDITFSNKLSNAERKNLKNKIIRNISKELNLEITDWQKARSRRDYNCYTFNYIPLEGFVPQSIIKGVKMEVVLGSNAYPTQKMKVDSYIYNALKEENTQIINSYNLFPFYMNVQSLDRTFIDKVFALCDYHLNQDYNKHSRHIYDLYMLYPKINFNETFIQLIKEVRFDREKMPVCPSAKDSINVSELLKEIVNTHCYEEDYMMITSYFQRTKVEYSTVIKVLTNIIELNIF